MKKIKAILGAGIFIISTGASLFLGDSSVYAETQVSADISEDTTWDLEGSPYIMQDIINISPGATLTVEPGVAVQSGNFSVKGSLKAEGTVDQPIYFGAPDSSQCDWSWTANFMQSESHLSHVVFQNCSFNLRFENGSKVDMDFLSTNKAKKVYMDVVGSDVSVDHSDFSKFLAFDAYQGSTATIANTVMHDLSGSIPIAIYDHSSLTLSDSNLSNVDWQVGLTVFGQSSVTVASSTIDGVNYSDAVDVYGGSSLDWHNSQILNTKGFGLPLAAWSDRTSGTTTVNVFNGIFSGGEANGLTFFGPVETRIVGSKVSGFWGEAISLDSGAKVSVDRTAISNNDTGLAVHAPSALVIKSSAIVGNSMLGASNYSADAIDLSGNWWGDPTGPYQELDNTGGLGNSVSQNVKFEPWLTEDPLIDKPVELPKCCSNVAFIPGLEGSRLYTGGVLSENQLWEPNRNADVEKLYLDKNGQSLNQSIYTRDIINSTNYPAYNIDIYKTFSGSMNALVSDNIINAWKPLSYDWRLGYDEILKNGTKISDTATSSMIQTIEELAAGSKTGKVSLVAHSNGGLLAKSLIEALNKEGKSDLVDKLILVAVPQLGTPQSIPADLHGYGQELLYGNILNSSVARKLAENMPTAYNLLPSDKYLNESSVPIVTFDPSIDSISNLRKIYGDTISDPAELSDFLLGNSDSRTQPDLYDTSIPNVLNSNLLTKAKAVHQDQDVWLASSSLSVSQIVGWGLDTVEGLKYQKKSAIVCTPMSMPLCVNKDVLDYRPLFDFNGDGTVMRSSADVLSAPTYYVNLAGINSSQNTNRAHGDILETKAVQNLVKNIVTGQQQLPENVLTSLPKTNSRNGLQVSIHSPVILDLYDNSGNHTGPLTNSDQTSDLSLYEAKIPNSYYLPFGEGVYAGVTDKTTTTVSLHGTDIGTFTLELSEVSEATTTNLLFQDLPVLPTTLASVVSSPATTSVLALDLDGDGKNDLTVGSGNGFDPIAYLVTMESVVGTFSIDQKIKKQLNDKIDKVIDLIKKGKIDQVDKKIVTSLKSFATKKSHNKIDTDDEQILVAMLYNLLDNLK